MCKHTSVYIFTQLHIQAIKTHGHALQHKHTQAQINRHTDTNTYTQTQSTYTQTLTHRHEILLVLKKLRNIHMCVLCTLLSKSANCRHQVRWALRWAAWYQFNNGYTKLILGYTELDAVLNVLYWVLGTVGSAPKCSQYKVRYKWHDKTLVSVHHWHHWWTVKCWQVSWFRGFIVSWFNGFIISWVHEFMVLMTPSLDSEMLTGFSVSWFLS